jgi:guanyl-specific ribonuclease Sa
MPFFKKILRLMLIGLALTGLASHFSISAKAQSLSPDYSIARSEQIQTVSFQELPPEARQTIRLIQKGGPYPHRQDNTIFGNRERRLPLKPRGYYREYTVPTPGAYDRGARRIVTGAEGEFYFTRDHYNSFFRVRMN